MVIFHTQKILYIKKHFFVLFNPVKKREKHLEFWNVSEAIMSRDKF
ncbi:hypothetical protein MIDIC_550002 [Alphaproteobacteria bacterium]